jgi:hypothetical protein
MGSPLLDAFKCSEGSCLVFASRLDAARAILAQEFVEVSSISKIYLFYEEESKIYDAAHGCRHVSFCWLRTWSMCSGVVEGTMTRVNVGVMTGAERFRISGAWRAGAP